ncbi:unnamed protein product [Haemonchus placei]|uniref:Uncharacterized protein n=1 Tax=Haemonchus placei TaxID=6290 RepID=A0A158QR56_HAEPC|nr:unnamed protein product [Haemonchus placei]
MVFSLSKWEPAPPPVVDAPPPPPNLNLPVEAPPAGLPGLFTGLTPLSSADGVDQRHSKELAQDTRTGSSAPLAHSSTPGTPGTTIVEEVAMERRDVAATAHAIASSKVPITQQTPFPGVLLVEKEKEKSSAEGRVKQARVVHEALMALLRGFGPRRVSQLEAGPQLQSHRHSLSSRIGLVEGVCALSSDRTRPLPVPLADRKWFLPKKVLGDLLVELLAAQNLLANRDLFSKPRTPSTKRPPEPPADVYELRRRMERARENQMACEAVMQEPSRDQGSSTQSPFVHNITREKFLCWNEQAMGKGDCFSDRIDKDRTRDGRGSGVIRF